MNPIVCLDAGHGGNDPGAVGQQGTKEADVALQLVLMIEEKVKNFAYTVLIRKSDIRINPNERAVIANNAKAALFVSVHCNGAENKEAHGTETLYHRNSKNGKRLAKCVQSELVKAHKLYDRGIKADMRHLAVLEQTAMPAILTEVAFVSNAEEEILLNDSDWLDKVASAISLGIKNYCKERGLM